MDFLLVTQFLNQILEAFDSSAFCWFTYSVVWLFGYSMVGVSAGCSVLPVAVFCCSVVFMALLSGAWLLAVLFIFFISTKWGLIQLFILPFSGVVWFCIGLGFCPLFWVQRGSRSAIQSCFHLLVPSLGRPLSCSDLLLLSISQFQLCPCPPHPPPPLLGLTLDVSNVLVLDGKYPGVGTKKEGNAPPMGYRCMLLKCEIRIHVDLSRSHYSV